MGSPGKKGNTLSDKMNASNKYIYETYIAKYPAALQTNSLEGSIVKNNHTKQLLTFTFMKEKHTRN